MASLIGKRAERALRSLALSQGRLRGSRAARPDSSRRKGRLLGMKSKLTHTEVLRVAAGLQTRGPRLWVLQLEWAYIVRVKQPIWPAMMFAALAVSAAAQGSSPLVTLDDAMVCHGKGSAGCIIPPRQTRAPQPEYPIGERHARRQGTVKLKLVVGSDGVPRDVAVSESLAPDFDKAAMDAVKQWEFTPAIKDGKPTAVQIQIEVQFHLR